MRRATPIRPPLISQGARAVEASNTVDLAEYAQNALKKLNSVTGTMRGLSGITKMLMISLEDPNFRQKLDTVSCTPFGNGVLDMRTGHFRRGTSDDYLSLGPMWKYADHEADNPSVKLYEETMSKMLRFTDSLGQLSDLQSCSLQCGNTNKVFHVVYGNTNGGKSAMMRTASNGLSVLCSALPVTAFTHDKRADASAHTAAFTGTMGTRITTLNEPQFGVNTLCPQKIKSLTGGDPVVWRGLFEGFTRTLISWVPWSISNTIPLLSSPPDDATSVRIYITQCRSNFSASEFVPVNAADQFRLGKFPACTFDSSQYLAMGRVMIQHAYTNFTLNHMHLPSFKLKRSRLSVLDSMQYLGKSTAFRGFVGTFVQTKSLLGVISRVGDRLLSKLSLQTLTLSESLYVLYAVQHMCGGIPLTALPKRPHPWLPLCVNADIVKQYAADLASNPVGRPADHPLSVLIQYAAQADGGFGILPVDTLCRMFTFRECLKRQGDDFFENNPKLVGFNSREAFHDMDPTMVSRIIVDATGRKIEEECLLGCFLVPPPNSTSTRSRRNVEAMVDQKRLLARSVHFSTLKHILVSNSLPLHVERISRNSIRDAHLASSLNMDSETSNDSILSELLKRYASVFDSLPMGLLTTQINNWHKDNLRLHSMVNDAYTEISREMGLVEGHTPSSAFGNPYDFADNTEARQVSFGNANTTWHEADRCLSVIDSIRTSEANTIEEQTRLKRVAYGFTRIGQVKAMNTTDEETNRVLSKMVERAQRLGRIITSDEQNAWRQKIQAAGVHRIGVPDDVDAESHVGLSALPERHGVKRIDPAQTLLVSRFRQFSKGSAADIVKHLRCPT